MKKLLALLAVLLVAGISVFFLFNNPLGRLVKLAVEEFGPKMTQADVRVNKVVISASDGQGAISGLWLGNPKGYKTAYALKADTVEIAIEPASIAQDVIVIHRILIDAPRIIYEKGDGGANFDAIQHNVEQYLGASDKDKKVERGAGKKVIIDSFVIRNARVNYNGLMDISLPDIELHDVGKKSGGATSAQVVRAIVGELNAKLVLALARTAAIGAVGGVAVSAGMAIKGLLNK
ncbi:MAG: hypothetical protein HY306_11550 [Nitrosomonadales bacterium]|nr:hypothetical protein [Nitrosomonadales bacterium]